MKQALINVLSNAWLIATCIALSQLIALAKVMSS